MNLKKATILAIILGTLLKVNTLLAATAHDWLAAQQNNTTGLVDSFEGDNSTVGYTYDQACAIIAFTCENDLVRAKKVLDAMMPLQFAEGSWSNGHYTDTATRTSTWRRSGETLWMMLAINYYTRKTGDTTYVNACQKAADWLITLQETNMADARYGSIYGGLTDVGARETWTSTEHNYDAYSAFYYLGEILNNQYYKDKAQLVYNWLVNKMWDNTAGRFYTGHNDYSTYLDPQSWSIVAIGKTGPAGQDFSRSISFAYNTMRLTRTYNSQTIEGFDYDGTIAYPGGGVWFEGTEQMALTYETLGDMTKANYFHSQTAKAQSANGGVLCAVGDGGDYWPTNFQHNAVATTSWYIFCSQSPRVNPFKPPVTTADTTAPVLSGIASSNITTTGANITWTTNEASNTQVEYGLTASYGNNSTLNSSLITSHSVVLSGLTASTLYHYRVKSRDAAGNLATSADYSFTTGTTAPQTKNYAPTAISVTQGTGQGTYANLAVDDSSYFSNNAMQNGTLFYTDWYVQTYITDAPATVTKLVFTFNGHYTSTQAQSLSAYNFTTSAWDLINSTTVGTTDQTIAVTLTTNLTNYVSSAGEIRLRIYAERTSNVCCYADYINFSVEINGTVDTTAPVFSSIASSGITTTGAVISWTTNEASNTQVEYGLTTSYGTSSTLNTSLVNNHSVTLSGLTANTLYHYRVKSKDVAGNLATSADYSFTTVALPTGKSYTPTGITITRGTVSGNYTYLNNNDGAYLTITGTKSGTTYATDWYAKTVIAEARSKVTKLTITYDGRLNRSAYQNLYLYNFVTSVWARMDYRLISTTDKTITITTNAIASYISSSGEICLRSYVASSGNLTNYADQVKFSVEFNTAVAAVQNIDEDAPAVPGNGEVKLYNNVFNPAKGESAMIDYTIENDGQVTVKLYNIVGELVRTLVDESRPAGNYTESWNGQNDSNETVASGVYLCFIEAPGIKVIKKTAVIK